MPADYSEVFALEAHAIREIDRTYENLMKVTEQGIRKEKRGHPYQNRTENLERTTVATVHGATPDGGVCTMQMGMPYASYVNERGYSLIDRVAKEADERHREHLEKVAEGIASR